MARRVLALVHGEVTLDEQLLSLVDSEQGAMKRLGELELAGDSARRIERSFERGGLILVHGRVGQGRRSALTAAAVARGVNVLIVRARCIAKERDDAQRQLRAIARDCRLQVGVVSVSPIMQMFDAAQLSVLPRVLPHVPPTSTCA